MPNDLLKIGPHITVLPVIHGSGDFALEVRRAMLEQTFDVVAVPLPPSFQQDVERAIEHLPTPTVVVQPESQSYVTQWTPDRERDDEESEADSNERVCSYVPIDPCQAVIMAIRVAMGERIPRRFIDLETSRFEPYTANLPDPYALKKVTIERFAAAILPNIERVPEGQRRDRVRYMAGQLHEIESRHQSILLVCSVLDWPWIREAYQESADNSPTDIGIEDDFVEPTATHEVDPKTLIFMLGELPFVTGLYERARSELEDDQNLSIDGVKELLVTARDAYRNDLKRRARKITPHLLARCTKYIRNLSLVESRLTPDLYTIVVAAKQIAGDQFALHVAETARDYAYSDGAGFDSIVMGINEARYPNGDTFEMVSRLPGPPLEWRSCELKRRPDKSEIEKWRTPWNPFSQCSYPPEDESIENFRSHVFDRAKAIMGADLVRTEKFTTSIMDGIDIRDTLRHWYDGEIYVKILPPSRGKLDCAVMLFDSPADPRDYPWRTTWFAEHENESTLAFFATDFQKEMVGPGIGQAVYGGAMFLFPPILIPDVWNDPRVDFCETLEERLLAAACLHSNCPEIALLSPLPPGPGWRRLAKRFKKTWVHVPLGQFGESTVQQLRMVHVLNGREVRSFAAHFIRRA
ncbi:MAG TPA: hypothetical protein QF564_20235 [Pirellulaceae bacterium]|jgi:hypothetical protein|nr:hypothetical protein [Pirellulaceae bacterium]